MLLLVACWYFGSAFLEVDHHESHYFHLITAYIGTEAFYMNNTGLLPILPWVTSGVLLVVLSKYSHTLALC